MIYTLNKTTTNRGTPAVSLKSLHKPLFYTVYTFLFLQTEREKKVMIFQKHPRPQGTRHPVSVGNTALENVTCYNYLAVNALKEHFMQ